MSIKVGINGFGRIGRIFYRASLKDDEFNKKFAIEMGADEYITKPFTSLDLLNTVKRFLTNPE